MKNSSTFPGAGQTRFSWEGRHTTLIRTILKEESMKHELMELPFEKTALEPHISAETVEYHYGKHHATYLKNLITLSEGTHYETMKLEDIIRSADAGPLFNNAAQVFNHDFYWKGLTCTTCSISAELEESIARDFGSMEQFKEAFLQSAATLFGSGWNWLSIDKDGKLIIEQTSNADTPLRHGRTPLLTCDVWEHAYYIDYRNARPEYLQNWWNLINWNFVSDNLAAYKEDEIQGYSQPCNEPSEVCDYVDTMQENERTST
jgi:Fe-Mn family superoxide dismutase